MKVVIIYILFGLLFLFSCGKKTNRESQQQAMQEQARQQAIQDSIALAQARKEAQLAAQRERERMNKQEADSSTTSSTTEHEPVDSVFSSSGDYALQVSSWRSQWKAQKELQKWRDRGYTNAYLMKYGNEKTGDVWFRVRLGHLQNRSGGKQIGKEISSKYNINFWIAHI